MRLAPLAALALLSGCATQATLGPLHEAQLACQVQRNPQACASIPILQEAAHDEARTNALLTAGLVLLVPLAILAAGADAPPEPDVVIIHRRY